MTRPGAPEPCAVGYSLAGSPWFSRRLSGAFASTYRRPTPGPAAAASTRRVTASPTVEPKDYALAEGEAIRYISAPSDQARQELLGKWRLHNEPDVLSITVMWDGEPHVHSMQVGHPYVTRRLLYVLRDSLDIPLYRLDETDVALQIGLPGDWVVRRDATLEQRMAFLENVVQQHGYPGFRIVRTEQRVTAYEMHGVARAPDDPIVLLRPLPDASPPSERTGSLAEFGQVLSVAIQRRVVVRAEPADLRLTWQDNSPVYLALGRKIDGGMVTNLLHEISADLGVEFTTSDDPGSVWRLKLDE